MTRISLRETYDNRSVIAQIAKVTDTAEDAAETVEQKAAEINDALTDVNAAVQAAEGAVTTANAASAAAQQSAQTVSGYNTRLTTAEGEIDTLQSDLNGVTLRVQTAEGNIVTIQGQITALQTADGQNVKIDNINQHALGLTGNQTAGGVKTGNFYTATGSPVYSSSDPTRFTSLCNLGAVGTAVAIGFSIVTRTNVCIGCIIISSNGTPTYVGTKGTSGSSLTLGVGTVNDELHLLVKRNTSAGQNIALNIFGIIRGNTRITPPPGDIGDDATRVVNSSDYVELVSL